jgi:hypothetical protein
MERTVNVDIPEGYVCDECGALVDESYRGSRSAHDNLHNDIEELQSQVEVLREAVEILRDLAML